jgi:hypothetical protein
LEWRVDWPHPPRTGTSSNPSEGKAERHTLKRTPPVGEQTTEVVMLALLGVPLWLRTAITVCLVLLFLSYLGEMIFQ